MITRGEQGTALRNQLEIESALIDVEDNQIELAWEKLKPKLGPEARALERARDEIKKRKARFTATAENNTRFLKFNMFLFEQLRIFIYVGIGLAAIGFSLWYWKVQRYMDKELREQSAQA